jgi:hypothetical protein
LATYPAHRLEPWGRGCRLGLGWLRLPHPRRLAVHRPVHPGQGLLLLDLVADGATLLADGTSGHKTPDASLNRPWPGVLASVGEAVIDTPDGLAVLVAAKREH